MTCRAPLEAAQRPGEKPKIYNRGTRPRILLEGYRALELPCKQCTSCRLERSRQMATRMMHEAAWWEENYARYSIFLTLTYNDEHLPYGGMLVKDHVQNFVKRLRRKISPDNFRYYIVGEYGSQCPDHEIEKCSICGPLQRPHYHCILFGWTPPGHREVVGTREGYTVYRSDIIDEAWRKTVKPGEKKTEIGKHEWGSVTFESCQYVARYIIDKIVGDEDKVANHYEKIIWQTGEIVQLPQEFSIVSKGGNTGKKGIGYQFYEQHMADIYPYDECPIPGRSNVGKPPKYYDGHYEKDHPQEMEKIKEARRLAMAKSLVDGPSIYSRAKYEDHWLKLRRQGL